ncbi:MAG: ribosome maturation factor [Candidatus Eisenbacteria bacterium]|nr:ribosome maturation factor [Candidatus Eisenbacteria bacterium]
MRDRSERIYERTHALIEGMGYRLVDVREARRDGRRLVQFFIDEPRGVSVEDCADVSRELGYVLDAEPEFDDGYVLEVSSPGLDHDLRREREYRYFTGRKARLVMKGGKLKGRAIVGTIAAADEGTVLIDAEDGERLSLAIDDIARARLVIEGL